MGFIKMIIQHVLSEMQKPSLFIYSSVSFRIAVVNLIIHGPHSNVERLPGHDGTRNGRPNIHLDRFFSVAQEKKVHQKKAVMSLGSTGLTRKVQKTTPRTIIDPKAIKLFHKLKYSSLRIDFDRYIPVIIHTKNQNKTIGFMSGISFPSFTIKI